MWGWQKVETGQDTLWRAMGVRLGWLDSERQLIYLNPHATYAAVQLLARDNGEPLPLSSRTMGKRLKEAGWLVGESSRPRHLTTRITVHDQRQEVYAIPKAYLFPQEVNQVDQLDQPCDSGNAEQRDKPLISQNVERLTSMQTEALHPILIRTDGRAVETRARSTHGPTDGPGLSVVDEGGLPHLVAGCWERSRNWTSSRRLCPSHGRRRNVGVHYRPRRRTSDQREDH